MYIIPKVIRFLAISLITLASMGYTDDVNFSSARIESCRGCSLNRLPEVKKFIYEDLPQYEGVEFKPIHGAPPELVLLDSSEKEVERLPLSQLTREQCNKLLIAKGFTKAHQSVDEL